MVKNMFFINLFIPDALTIVGWISFVLGIFFVEAAWFKLVLLSVARVLPRLLRISELVNFAN